MDAVPPHTIQWLPENVQWILYRRVCEVWHHGQMPTDWTDARISLLYNNGDPRDASNYRPIAVSTCMYQITTKSIVRRIKTPLTEVLSEHQAGGRRGHTTLSQAIKLWSSALNMPETPDVVLLDIAKAYPSTPHPLLWAAMQQVGVPDRYISMMQYTYQETRCYYRVNGEKHSYHQRRGVKEGCPLSRLLFCVVYEMFRGTLAVEFPSVHFCAYMDDVAFISPDRWTTMAVLRRVTDLGNTLGFHLHKGKTEVYCWSATYKVDQLLWDGQVNTVRPPIFSHPGHIIAHPEWAHKARSDYLVLIRSDLAQYAHIPMDGWERKQVVISILMPRWLHRAVLIPLDRW